MNDLIKKFVNYETISYIVVGVLTTVVDYVVFALINESLKKRGAWIDPVMTAQLVSFVAAVAFAYIANKIVVFKNLNFRPAYLVKEITGFAGARVLSFVICSVFILVTVNYLHWNEYISKVLSSIFNLVFNYAASKFFIFKK